MGSHLVDRLMLMGHEIMVIDNFFTGQKGSLGHWVSCLPEDDRQLAPSLNLSQERV